MKRLLALSACVLLSGCNTFALSYQNYFTKNFAYVASKYDGDPNRQLSDGAESNNFEDGNRAAYQASEFPSLIFGFRTLEHHNSQYTSGGNMDELIVGTFTAPGKTDPVTFVTLTMSGSNINAQGNIAEVKAIQMIKMTYPAIMVTVDNAALQKAYGTGAYTLTWKSLKSDGQAEDRMLSQVTTNLVP